MKAHFNHYFISINLYFLICFGFFVTAKPEEQPKRLFLTKNDHSVLPNGRARGWSFKKSAQMADFSDNGHERSESLCSSVFKPQAQIRSVKKTRTAFLAKNDEALTHSEQAISLNKNNEVFLRSKEIMFYGNVGLIKKGLNDNFANQNLKQNYEQMNVRGGMPYVTYKLPSRLKSLSFDKLN